MKTKITFLTISLFLGLSKGVSAQDLVKDLNPGPHPASSSPDDFRTFNGSFYFVATKNVGNSFIYQLWKSAGTEASTVLVKDDLTGVTNIAHPVKIRATTNDFLYFTVLENPGCSTCSTELWKTDGTTDGTVLVKNLEFVTPFGGGFGSEPSNFVGVEDQLFFTFAKDNGNELWKSDGTDTGTAEVIDLLPGVGFGSYPNSGLDNSPMAAFNGKVYFSASNATPGDFELFSSDGTAAGTMLVHEVAAIGNSFEPNDWTVFNNELYLNGNDGVTGSSLWKTDGVTMTQLSFGVDAGAHAVFNGELYFAAGADLWKTDGTVAGTALFHPDMVSSFSGANSDYLFTEQVKYIPTPPYYEYHYWRTDGNVSGTEEVDAALASKSSFVVLDNKMYTNLLNTGTFTSTLWSSDGTEAGVDSLFAGYIGNPYVFGNSLYFSFYTAEVGYELFTIGSGTAEILQQDELREGLTLFPNPSKGKFSIKSSPLNPVHGVEILTLAGEKIRHFEYAGNCDLSGFSTGVYLARVYTEKGIFILKVILE